MGVPQPLRVSKGKKSSRPISEARKVRKPLMEKRRRDRINACLSSLATLLADPNDVIPSSSGTSSCASKKLRLEKADILDQTVQHWHKIKPKSFKGSQENVNKDLTHENPYVLGYEGCMEVIQSLLKELEKEGEDISFAEDLRSHLQKHLKRAPSEDEIDQTEILDVESKVETILTLLPKWLPSGDFALIVQEFPDEQAASAKIPASGYCENLSENNFQRLSSPMNMNDEGQHLNDCRLNLNDIIQSNVWRPW